MVLFLGLEVSEDRLLCVEGQKDGSFKRSGLRKLEYDPYTPEMRAAIDGLVRTVDGALRGRKLPGVSRNTARDDDDDDDDDASFTSANRPPPLLPVPSFLEGMFGEKIAETDQ
ncbi:hypothetical protein ANANG_G00188140 [Anguilla anguilla]|uniref:Uncharacterized protein n=1 Tax=Anguilla anguilla TaxID=7936 RepID=A0A9D3M0L2_ANGAN|nr:hypothetical protein ANANG_G00188140 [Anguilla anguilla]